MINKRSDAKARKRKLSRILGFSLMELIVVIAILAVFTVMLTPALVSYVETSRAQKDTAALNEVTNAVVVGLSDYDAFDEMYKHGEYNNVSCYIDKSSEAGLKKIITSRPGAEYEQYTFGDEAREANRSVYYLAGNMYGLTITLQPEGDKDNRFYDVGKGIINKYIDDGEDLKLSDCEALYNSIRRTIGDTVSLTSQTYKNSEYTIFIRLSIIDSDNFFAQDSVVVYGQYGGTNLGKGPHVHKPTDDRGIDDSVGGDDDCVHNVVDVAETPANCGYNGLTSGSYCSICGKVFKAQSKIPATGNHTWETSADGCTRTCKVCGRTEQIKEPHVHNYVTNVIPGTCINMGSTVYTCDCGDSYSEQNIPMDANRHEGEHTKKLTKKNACLGWTCCGAVYSTEHTWSGTICTACGYDSMSDHVHVYNLEVVDSKYWSSDANCQSPTKYYKSCSCGAAGSETFNYGSKNPNNHVGEHTKKLANENECLGWTCCDAVYSTTHNMSNGECTICGYKEAHVHVYDQQVVSVDYRKSVATCKAAARYYYSCSCGAAGTSTFASGGFDATNHVDEPTKKLATENQCMGYPCCNAVYSTTHTMSGNTCTTCGYTKSHVHVYNVQTASASYLKDAATCTTKATYYYSCSCGASGNDTFESGEVNPNNHTGDSENGGTVNVHTRWSCCKATISSDHSYDTDDVWSSGCSSVTVYKNCDCGYGYTVGSSYSVYDAEPDKVGTCAAQGRYDHYAYVNGTQYRCPHWHSIDKDPNNHVGPYTESSQDATCVATGYYKKTCSACTNVVEETTYEKDLSNHVGGTETTVTTEATCVATGLKTTTCNSCGEAIGTEEIPINSSNHSGGYSSKVIIASTCTMKGTTKYTCKNGCGYNYDAQDVDLNKYNHSRGYSASVTTAATCKTKGITTYTCKNGCGYSYTSQNVALDSSNHEDARTYSTKSYPCSTVTEMKCYACNASWTTRRDTGVHNYHYVDNNGMCESHCQYCGVFGVGTTHENDGSCLKYCWRCKTAFGSHTPGAEATCTTAQVCTVCNQELVPKLGHAWGNYVYTYMGWMCQRCHTVVHTDPFKTPT